MLEIKAGHNSALASQDSTIAAATPLKATLPAAWVLELISRSKAGLAVEASTGGVAKLAAPRASRPRSETGVTLVGAPAEAWVLQNSTCKPRYCSSSLCTACCMYRW